MRGDAVESCAGFLVQVTPEGTRADLERLVENLDTLPPLESAMSVADPDAREWAGRLLTGFRWDQCAREKVAFVCRCSRDRVVAALASLPKADLLELSAGGIPTETVCEFCNETYRIPVSELRGLLEPS